MLKQTNRIERKLAMKKIDFFKDDHVYIWFCQIITNIWTSRPVHRSVESRFTVRQRTERTEVAETRAGLRNEMTVYEVQSLHIAVVDRVECP